MTSSDVETDIEVRHRSRRVEVNDASPDKDVQIRHRSRRIDVDNTPLDAIKRRVDRETRRILAHGSPRQIAIWQFAEERCLERDDPGLIKTLGQLKRFPVTIDEFVESPEFLGNQLDIWPTLRDDLRAMNPDVFLGDSPIHEALLGGAIGTGKTTLAQVTLLYRLYLFTCFRQPQSLFGLAPSTPIVFTVQSLSPTVTERAIYRPLREMFEAMPFAQQYLRWDRRRETALVLDSNIMVVQALAVVEATVGQAIAGGILDEVNYMLRIENSTRVPGPRGQGGRYDQAEETYSNLVRRMHSRFTTQGFSLGCLCVLSSTRYRGDFLDDRMEEVDTLAEENFFVARHKQYEVVPQERFSGATFRLIVGDQDHETRILDNDEVAPPGALVEAVPVEYVRDFRRDPENALRDILGIATDVISPFIRQRGKINDAFARGEEIGLRPWVDNCDVDYGAEDLPRWIPKNMPRDLDTPRFIHIDLALTGDAVGISVVKVFGLENTIVDPDDPDIVERRLHFAVECAVRIRPDINNPIDIAQLRGWIMQLKTRFELNLHTVSYDSFQSAESIQHFRSVGIRSRMVSVDRTLEPYQYLRECTYHDQIAMVDCDPLRTELAQLEFRANRNRVDHPPRGSKDVADAVCGAIFQASLSRLYRSAGGYVDQEGRQHRASGERTRPNPPRPQGDRRPRINRISGSYYSSGFIPSLIDQNP